MHPRLSLGTLLDVDQGDVTLRNRTYGAFVQLGRAPDPAEVAHALEMPVEEVLAGWRRLHDAHALVLDRSRQQILMANPFAAVPTPYQVLADGVRWYANCAWDAFGICAALHVDGFIETQCADCGQEISVAVRGERPEDETLLFHCLVPAARWWDDIAFT